MSDGPVAKTSICKHKTVTIEIHLCLRAGFEPATPASERPQTHDSDCEASGIGFAICGSKLLSVAIHGPRVNSEIPQPAFISENLHDCELFTGTPLVRTTCIIRKVKENELKGK